MKTAAAVGELMQAAFTLYGGEGDAGAVILREKTKRMRIYLSGAISKIPYEEAFELFEHAERIIENFGHEPVNPMKEEGNAEGLPWIESIAIDIILLDACDGIYLLENWMDSDGARVEHFIATVRGKRIFFQGTSIPPCI